VDNIKQTTKILKSNINIIPNKKGDICKGISIKDKLYSGFGEVYFYWVKKNAIKAWKRHLKISSIFVVPYGQVKFVCYYRGRFFTEIIGEKNYVQLKILPKVWYGFMGISKKQNLILSLIDSIHDNNEMEKKNLDYFKYNW